MKKSHIIILVVAIICIIFIVGTFILWKNPQIANQLVISFEDFIDNLTGKNQEIIYSNDFKINQLQCSQADFYYELLTDEQKKIYSSIAVAVKNMEENVKLKSYQFIDEETTSSDIDIALESFFSDHPEVFYVNNNYTISSYQVLSSTRVEINLSYLVSNSLERDRKINEVDKAVNEILNGLNGKTGYEAELYFHDKIGKDVKYYTFDSIEDVPADCHSIYGTLIKKEAVCDGFARTLKLLLDKVNIESIIVMGELDEQLHAWNMVNLEGKWYHLDLTSDKSIDDLKDISNVLIHSYFNITTDLIRTTHLIAREGQLPIADSLEKNYFVLNQLYIQSTDDFNEKFKNIVTQNKADVLEIKVKNVNSVPEKMVTVLRTNHLTDYLPNNATKFSYYNVLDTFIITKAK